MPLAPYLRRDSRAAGLSAIREVQGEGSYSPLTGLSVREHCLCGGDMKLPGVEGTEKRVLLGVST